MEDSDDESSSLLRNSSKNASKLVLNDVNVNANSKATDNGSTKVAPKNKAFTCCVVEYGIKVDEEDPSKADAGEGKRYQRMYGLFGTQIRS